MKIFLMWVFSGIFVALPCSAAIYKCEVDGAIEYLDQPCEEETTDVTESNLSKVNRGYSRNSLRGTIRKTRELKDFWSCQTLNEAYTNLPSALSVENLFHDFLKQDEMELETMGKVTIINAVQDTQFFINNQKVTLPYCSALGKRYIRSGKASFSLSVRAHQAIPDNDSLPPLKVILKTLGDNGYILEKTKDNLFEYPWSFFDNRCRAILSTVVNSNNELKGAYFGASCRKRPAS